MPLAPATCGGLRWGVSTSRCLRALLPALLLALPVAGASPASDLFRSATEQVAREYYGWSTADLKALSEKYDALLRVRCSDQGEACSYATGREVLTNLFKEFGDAHTNVRDPEGAERLREVTQDPPSSAPGRGWPAPRAACWWCRSFLAAPPRPMGCVSSIW